METALPEVCVECGEDPCICKEEKVKVEEVKDQLPPRRPVLKAIREKCLDCSFTWKEVVLCPCTDCSLWPYRRGKNPYRIKRVVSEEQRKAAGDRFAKARAARGNKEN